MAAEKGRTKRVVVVGAGVIGLSSAVNIIETIPNVEVTLIAEHFEEHMASSVSGGLWNPREVPLNGTPMHVLRKWGKETWDHSIPLALSSEASKIGIEFIPGYRLYPEMIKEEEEPWWKDDVIGYRRVPQKEIKQLFASTFKDGYFYMTMITNCPIYLPYLMKRFLQKGGKAIQRKVDSFGEFAGVYDVVVNCTGLGAKFLAQDDALEPLRGQIIRVRAPMQHFFILYSLKAGMKGLGNRSFYVFPRNGQVVLGGTYQHGRWDTKPSQEDAKYILDKASQVLPNLKGSEVVKHLVGLRPCRSKGVRLEAETMNFGALKIEVVHNYGHEGNGVTLHWGCAKETTRLVQQILEKSSTLQARL
ncbi:D-aspartate oxidase-like [Lytechinus pictus]|uniref:D-aspartate oxidase-like n=1 Tax=Lytechinus pictus TaxID=7653 RepID=UPI0030B9BAC7